MVAPPIEVGVDLTPKTFPKLYWLVPETQRCERDPGGCTVAYHVWLLNSQALTVYH